MGAGKFDQWLVFQKMPSPEVQDSMGGSISVPATQFSTWGAFELIGTREFPAAQKRHAETTARFRIPYPDYSIDPARHQIVQVFDADISPPLSATWNVLGATPVDGRRFEMIIEVNQVS